MDEKIEDLINEAIPKIKRAFGPIGLTVAVYHLCRKVVKYEREECAKLVELSIIGGRAWNDGQEAHALVAKEIARAIRGRADVV